MSTFAGKKIVVIGGSSGIGYAVAKAALFYQADHVLVASSSSTKVASAVSRLLAEPLLQSLEPALTDRVGGGTVDLKDTESITAFFDKVGEFDHLVLTGGALSASPPFLEDDLEKRRDAFDLKFWGSATAAQKAKIRAGGSITLTIGSTFFKPPPTWPIRVGTMGAVDALARALAVELAPLRVNVVCAGAVDTELWDAGPMKAMKEKFFVEHAAKLPVKHIASADEVAEAYIFLMKCNFITGERIVVDGGVQLV